MTFRIRPAIAADAPAIAEIHYAGWQIAYAHVVSDVQMAGKLPERRIPFWQARIAELTDLVLIAEDETGKPLGFVHGGGVLEHDIRVGGLTGYDCEIYSLHCRLDVQGRGLGRMLMAETARTFRERGRTALMLWAYRDNPYRRFYEKIGGQIIAEGFDDDIPDVAYGWLLTRLSTLDIDARSMERQ
ncbi:GNAT family N-acetyltransferase [Dongia deserti]|uniref:GNAT family N-acetyltransferase n=1 Tax=Dongia deserti TaxID=2268030 RepID=UPI000E650B74|nr:GNAT family N-acetyltransferase [Dongia deserti]